MSQLKTTQLFTTPAEIDKAISDLRVLIASPGWGVIVSILDQNIAVVTEQIINKGDADEAEMDRLRGNLKIMRDIRNTPEDMIEKLSRVDEPDSEEVDAENVYDYPPDRPAPEGENT